MHLWPKESEPRADEDCYDVECNPDCQYQAHERERCCQSALPPVDKVYQDEVGCKDKWNEEGCRQSASEPACAIEELIETG